MIHVFIDGNQGTTGLRIHERFSVRPDVKISVIPDEYRKDLSARKDFLNAADIAFLCLPDDAALEAVSLIENPNVKLIDASTAHRTNPAWAYGFPELSASHREKVASGKRIAVPGCHASGFVSIVYPLVAVGILPKDYPIVSYSLTGYSGGGKKMIAEYQGEARSALLDAPRQYGLTQKHKHLPEMKAICGLDKEPCFAPIVADFYSGMEVSVPIFGEMVGATVKQVHEALASHYAGSKMVKVLPLDMAGALDGGGMLSANKMSGRDDMLIAVTGNDQRILVVSLFDNLGKGASGAAVQCMNVMCGLADDYGLTIGE